MHYKNSNITYLLIPILLLICLMTVALINYPVLFTKATSAIIITFAATLVYFIIWTLLKPDSLLKNWGLLVGFLFIINISVEDFIGWQTKTATVASTLTMMFLIFISFAIISSIKTLHTGKIINGLKGSLISACLGTLIALCFGFLICYLFPNKMTEILQSDRGFKDYTNPKEFTFFNAFDNASSHVIIAPIVSLIMGSLGGAIALIILRLRRKKQPVK